MNAVASDSLLDLVRRHALPIAGIALVVAVLTALSSGGVTLLSTLVQAGTTVALAFFTYRYVRLTQALLEQSQTANYPAVSVDLDFTDSETMLVVRNLGKTAARNIRFKVDDRIPWPHSGEGFASVKVIQTGISYLPPGRHLRYLLGHLPRDGAFYLPGSGVTIALEYQTEGGQPLSAQFEIDTSQYNAVWLSSFREPVDEISETLKEISRRQDSKQMRKEFGADFMTRQCPSCMARISPRARKCRYCHEYIEPIEQTDTHAAGIKTNAIKE